RLSALESRRDHVRRRHRRRARLDVRLPRRHLSPRAPRRLQTRQGPSGRTGEAGPVATPRGGTPTRRTLEANHHARREGALSARPRPGSAHSDTGRAAEGLLLRHEREDGEPGTGLAPEEDPAAVPGEGRSPAAEGRLTIMAEK